MANRTPSRTGPSAQLRCFARRKQLAPQRGQYRLDDDRVDLSRCPVSGERIRAETVHDPQQGNQSERDGTLLYAGGKPDAEPSLNSPISNNKSCFLIESRGWVLFT